MSELHVFRGQPGITPSGLVHTPTEDNDWARTYVGQDVWTLDAYDAKAIKALTELGAKRLPSAHDGALFVVNAKQLIQYIAATAGLNVEFPKRKKPNYSPETLAAMRERMAKMRQKSASSSETNG